MARWWRRPAGSRSRSGRAPPLRRPVAAAGLRRRGHALPGPAGPGDDPVQLQRTAGPIEPAMGSVLAGRVVGPARATRSARGRGEQPDHRDPVDDLRDHPRDAHRPRPGALRLPRAGHHEHPDLPADVDAGDRPGRLAADDVHRLGPAAVHPPGRRLPAQHHDDHPRPHHVQHQLRRGHREGPAAGLPAPSRGGGDGPRRERMGDLLAGDLPAHPAGHHGRGAAGVQPVDRRLRHHQLHGRPDADLPAVHLRLAVARHPASRSTSSAR